MHSLFMGALGAVLGAVVVGLLSSWVMLLMRPAGPGSGTAQAFAVMFLAIWGAILGLVAGIKYARMAAEGTGSAFIKGLGTVAAVVVVLSVAGGVFQYFRYREPRVEGKLVDLDFEFRAPAGYQLPETEPGLYPGITLEERESYHYPLRREDAALVDGRWGWRGTIPLQTTAREKRLNVLMGTQMDAKQTHFIIGAYFALRLGTLTRADFEWSEWAEANWVTTQGTPARDPGFNLRYRVRFRDQDHLGQHYFSTPMAGR